MSFSKRVSERVHEAHRSDSLLHNRFEVVDVLTGGMGIVYLCVDRQDGGPIALKTFKPEFLPNRDARDRFLREGTMWVNLGYHPHIVRCYQVFSPQLEPEVYLALEWIVQAEGKRDASLRGWLAPGQPLSYQKALLFGLHISRGMKHAVTTIPGLVHRDLKPENVLVGRDGLARVTDFGLASTLAELHTRESMIGTLSGELHRTHLTQGPVGTPPYMAPEQWTGQTRLDARADIYALGCILYEMITGRMAVSGNNIQELEYAHQAGRLNELPQGLPKALHDLLRRCLNTHREDRYADWGEVENAVMAAYCNVTGEKAPGEMTTEGETHTDRIMAGYSYNAIGDSYRELGKYDAAMKYFEKVRRIGQSERDSKLEAAGLHGLGVVYANLGDVRQAIKHYEEALASVQGIDLTAVQILASMGNAYRDLGEMQQAIDFYDQALAYTRKIGDRPREGGVLSSLGNLHRRLGRVQEAITFYEQALTITEETGAAQGTVLGNLGIAYRNLGKPDEAIRFQQESLGMAQAIGDRAGEGRALNNLGMAFSDLGDMQEAVGFFERALTISREIGMRRLESTIMSNLGNSWRNLGEIQRAIEFSRRALAIAQETGDKMGVAQTSLSLALSLSEQLQWADALNHAQVAASMFKQVGHVEASLAAEEFIEQIKSRLEAEEHCERGATYADQGRWNEAIGELRAALRINPDYVLAHYNLGAVYYNQGRLEEAIQEYKAALRSNPTLADAHNNLGLIYAQQGRLDEAFREWQAALRIRPNDAEVHYNLGVVYEQLGRTADAIREYEAALRVNPDWAGAHYKLGVIYGQQGHLEEAIRQFRHVLRSNPTHIDAHTSLGVTYAQQGRLGEAMREFKAALDINPNDAEVHYNLGLIHYDQGRWDEAIHELRAALRLHPDDAEAH